jgi:hypothetical protein
MYLLFEFSKNVRFLASRPSSEGESAFIGNPVTKPGCKLAACLVVLMTVISWGGLTCHEDGARGVQSYIPYIRPTPRLDLGSILPPTKVSNEKYFVFRYPSYHFKHLS